MIYGEAESYHSVAIEYEAYLARHEQSDEQDNEEDINEEEY